MAKLFRKYGTRLSVDTPSGTSTVYGFVQHSVSITEKYILPVYTPLGEVPRGYCRMMLPLSEVRVGDLVLYNGKWHIARRVERVWFGKKAIYEWCLCEERGEGSAWGQ